MRHKEKRRCSPTDFYSVGAERGRPWTEVRRAWSYMRRQGRDGVHQSCAAVPSAFFGIGGLRCYSSRALVVPYVDLLAGLWLLLFGLLFVSLFGPLVFEGSLVSGLLRPSRPVASLGGRRAGSFCPPALRGPRVFRCGGVLPPLVGASVSVGLLFMVRPGLRRFPHGFCIWAVFAAFSELRGVRQVERFAECSFF